MPRHGGAAGGRSRERAGELLVVVSCSLVLAVVSLVVSCGGHQGGTGLIHVTSTPPGAAVSLDGASTGQATPTTLTGVSAGNHVVAVALAGYATPTGKQVTVVAGQTATVDFTLTPLVETGSILVTSTPAGPRIYLDGADTGYTSPYTLTGVPAGAHAIRLALAGYQDWEESVPVVVGQTTLVSATLIPAAGGGGLQPGAPWPKFKRDARNTGLSPYVGPQLGQLQWRFQTGGDVDGAPAIAADGTLYFGSCDGGIYALNPDGSLKWQYLTAAAVIGVPAIGADGTVYAGSHDNYIYALNPDGTRRWRYQTDSIVCSGGPAIAADGTLYFGSGDCYLYAIDRDGRLKWRFQTGALLESAPAIGAGGTIYAGSDDTYLYAISPDGTLRWQFQAGAKVPAPPAIGADGTVYVGGWTAGCLYALNPDSTEKWRCQTGERVNSSPALAADGTIYFGSYDHYVYALDPDGTEKWRFQTGGEVSGPPTIDAEGTVYVGSWDHYLYALWADGTLKWRFQAGDALCNSGSIGSDGTLYFGCEDGSVYAIQ